MPPTLPKGTYLTTAEAAAVLGISPATLKRWAQSGLIRSQRTEGGHRRFRVEDVRAIAEPPPSSDDPVRRGADFVIGSSDTHSLQGWLLQARRELGSWWAVSHPLRGLAAELYRRRDSGALGRVQLEVALDRLRTALVRFVEATPTPLGAPVLLVGAVPGDPYLLAPAVIQVAALESGWCAEWVGHPGVEDLAAELQRRPARAVLICGSLAMEPEVVAEHAEQVARLGERLQVAVAALGMGEWPELAAPLVRLSTARDAQGWLEGLLGQPAVAAGPAGQAGPPGDPAALRWSPALALGHAAVDAQHETLFLHAGRFVEAVRRGEADAVEMLAFIGDYAQTHFRAEEHLMRESGYPALDEHRWEHEQFVRRFTLLERSLESEPTAGGLAALGQFLVEWLRAHVGGSDQRIRDHLRRAPAP